MRTNGIKLFREEAMYSSAETEGADSSTDFNVICALRDAGSIMMQLDNNRNEQEATNGSTETLC